MRRLLGCCGARSRTPVLSSRFSVLSLEGGLAAAFFVSGCWCGKHLGYTQNLRCRHDECESPDRQLTSLVSEQDDTRLIEGLEDPHRDRLKYLSYHTQAPAWLVRLRDRQLAEISRLPERDPVAHRNRSKA